MPGQGPQPGPVLLDKIVDNLYHAGLSLQAALNRSHEADRQHIERALQYVDDTIRKIRNHVFPAGHPQVPPDHGPPNDAR